MTDEYETKICDICGKGLSKCGLCKKFFCSDCNGDHGCAGDPE